MSLKLKGKVVKYRTHKLDEFKQEQLKYIQ
jgi:hypothetical protein